MILTKFNSKYFIITLFFLVVGLFFLYKIFTIPSPNNYGSLIIAWVSVYTLIITNMRSNDVVKALLKRNNKLMKILKDRNE